MRDESEKKKKISKTDLSPNHPNVHIFEILLARSPSDYPYFPYRSPSLCPYLFFLRTTPHSESEVAMWEGV